MQDDFDPVTYRHVNDAWAGAMLPPITEKEAHKVFDKLVAKFGGRKMRKPWWAGRVNRAWASTKALDTQCSRGSGLPAAVHDAGHWVHKKLHPIAKTHCHPHAALEKAMIEHVVAKGWHLPKAKKAKAKATRADRIAHAEKLLKRWMTKKRRAETAIRKLSAKSRRLAREEAQDLISV
jgi:hypothetical protein